MKTPTHILVFRFSALGDVAMTVPVVRLLLEQHPALQITFVSDPFMAPLFEGIGRLQFIGADTRIDYKGIGGLWRLARKLSTDAHFTAIADLHNVLRTKILRVFLPGVRKAVINKGRAEKKELTRPVNKKLRQLKTGFQRYADVFAALGLPVSLSTGTGLSPATPKSQIRGANEALASFLDKGDNKHSIIGIAPFAKHLPKMYPIELTREVAERLAASGKSVILFGSGAEAVQLKEWETDSILSLAGVLSFRDELKVISNLDAMVSMDSANMHLASLSGVPVISVWGGTHPFLGFYGWGQPADNAVQNELSCRPSSVFGNRPCPVHGEQGCMQGITPGMICDRVMAVLR